MTDDTSPQPASPRFAQPWVPRMLAGVAIGSLLIAVVVRMSLTDLRSPPYAFSVPNAFSLYAPAWLSVAAGGLLVAWGVRQRRIDVVTDSLIGAGIAAVVFFGWTGIAGWKVVDRRELPDGRTFIWFIQTQWLDPPDHLARLEESGWFADEYVVVGRSWWGTARHWAVISPRGEEPGIRLLSNGVVAVVGHGDVLVMEGTPPDADESEWVGKLPHVPVFALIGATGEGDPGDVSQVLSAIGRARERGVTRGSPGSELDQLPSDSTLADALAHANPWVRETARRFILAGGDALYPEAMRALR